MTHPAPVVLLLDNDRIIDDLTRHRPDLVEGLIRAGFSGGRSGNSIARSVAGPRLSHKEHTHG